MQVSLKNIRWFFGTILTLTIIPCLIILWPRSEDQKLLGKSFLISIKDRPFVFSFQTLPQVENCGNLRVICVVQSAPKSFQIRNAIRETWGNSSQVQALKDRARLVFIIGKSVETRTNKKLQEEADIHKDLIIYDMLDSYKRLIFKSLIMAEFHRRICAAEILVKVDEDVIFNIDRFLLLLDEKRASAKSTSFIAGMISSSSGIIRQPGHRWYVAYDVLPGTVFPTYAKGLAYAISRGAVSELMANVHKQKYFELEDAFLTGTLSIHTNISFVQLYGNNQIGLQGWIPDNKRCINGTPTVFAVHHFKSADKIKNGWRNMLQQKC